MARLRLIDAVAIAAVALLALKTLNVLAGASKPAEPPAIGSADELPAFARVLAHARTNYVPPDVARTGSTPDKADKAKEAAPAPSAPPAPPKPAFEPAPTSISATERALLERLGTRRDELQQRNRDLELREKLIESAERKLEGRLNELKTQEERSEGAPAKRGEAEAAGLKSIVTMYETMKPKDAARIFDRLSLDILVPVVVQMNPRKMAEVLAVMSPEAAEKLTVALAQRARGGAPEPRSANASLPSTELPAIEPARSP